MRVAALIALLAAAVAYASIDGGTPTWKEHPPKWKRFDGGSWPPGDDGMQDWLREK